MSKNKEMNQFVRDSILSGYRHHSFSVERELSDFYLKGHGDSSLENILHLDTYAEILASDRIRALKNTLICLITVISRSSIRNGADSEISFSMSDFFINEVEKQKSEEDLQILLKEILKRFRELVDETQHQKNPYPVAKAIQYINAHLYGSCTVEGTAGFTGCNPKYLAALFRRELGLSPREYIRREKMKKALTLLVHDRLSVNETADILGYCNASHFIKEFKRFYGKTPRKYIS
ncbi:AraC family transcriptional regulator [Acetatifactor muris]|uniref:Xylose operon regulatory protein n=1 Tax=Acetatifactor muris TaxID=879566 RepID=A0A2K4ZQI7_9FIRM|nr:AraC family transcriptional regulator [Acetatifactor muris]MCR2051129.1 AraC family transcriptional regulator [Acetatifactor muris]SOY32740.1 Xylose operon regulatory protein [Acetatifactor muris]